MKVAVAKYPIGEPRDFEAFAARQEALLREAKAGGARLAVLPEYLALELAAMFAAATRSDLHASLAALQPLRGAWMALYTRLAREMGMWINAGSFLLDGGHGRYRNRSDVFAPDGGHLWQDKLRLTGFEKDTGVIESGDALKVFEVDGVRAGIAICYDSEFPLLARAQVEAGMELLLVPSCTDSLHGYWRVRLGAQARALEGQCYAVQSPTVGEAAWSPAVDINRGAAAIYGPPDRGMPENGVLAIGETDAAQWVFAEVDLARVAELRADGGVLNARHWAEQPGGDALPPVEVVDLR